jgi:DNA repair protein RadC
MQNEIETLLDRIEDNPRLLSRLLLATQPRDTVPVRNADHAYSLVTPHLLGQEVEKTVVIALDNRSRPVAVEVLAIGNDECTLFEPRLIFSWALKQGPNGAKAIILAHNHPSGNPEPSSSDISVTKRLADIGRMLQIKVADHIIVADDIYTSMASKAYGGVRGLTEPQPIWTSDG